jgi:hypothetical protein
VYGGGGIRPDVVIPDDTITTDERTFLLAISAKRQAINTVLQNYALELKGTVSRGFTVPPTWGPEVMHRIAADTIAIDPKFTRVANELLTRDLATRVARLSFGEAAAKARVLTDDHQLAKAIDLLQHNATQAQLLAAGTAAVPRAPKH